MKDFIEKLKVWLGISEDNTTAPVDTCEVKELFKNSFTVVKKYHDSIDPDSSGGTKITAVEWISIINSARPVIKNVKNWQAIKARLLDFKFDDGKEIVQLIVSQGYLPEKAEFIAGHLIEYIEKQIIAYNTNLKPIIAALKK